MPVVVTGAPPGSNTVITITGTIGSGGSVVTSTTEYNYQERLAQELARTGLNSSQSAGYLGVGALFLLVGGLFVALSKRKVSN